MSEEQFQQRLRSYLINLALFLLIVALCAWIRFSMALTDEVHQARIDLVAQLSALNATVQTAGNRVDSRGGDIAGALHTFGRRVDSNITDTRATIQNIGKSAQASTVQQIKETREVINDKLNEAAQSLAVVAQKAEEPDKPVQVTVPGPAAVPAPVIAPPTKAPVVHEPPAKKKRGFWKKVLPPWK